MVWHSFNEILRTFMHVLEVDAHMFTLQLLLDAKKFQIGAQIIRVKGQGPLETAIILQWDKYLKEHNGVLVLRIN